MGSLSNFFRKLFVEPTGNFFIQVFRYGFSGGFVFLVDFSLLYILTDLVGLHYLISSTISAFIGTLLSYFFNVKWVFNSRRFGSKSREITIFFIISGIGFVLTPVLMFVFTTRIGLYYLISKIIVTAITVTWNFFAKKLILFPEKHINIQEPTEQQTN